MLKLMLVLHLRYSIQAVTMESSHVVQFCLHHFSQVVGTILS